MNARTIGLLGALGLCASRALSPFGAETEDAVPAFVQEAEAKLKATFTNLSSSTFASRRSPGPVRDEHRRARGLLRAHRRGPHLRRGVRQGRALAHRREPRRGRRRPSTTRCRWRRPSSSVPTTAFPSSSSPTPIAPTAGITTSTSSASRVRPSSATSFLRRARTRRPGKKLCICCAQTTRRPRSTRATAARGARSPPPPRARRDTTGIWRSYRRPASRRRQPCTSAGRRCAASSPKRSTPTWRRRPPQPRRKNMTQRKETRSPTPRRVWQGLGLAALAAGLGADGTDIGDIRVRRLRHGDQRHPARADRVRGRFAACQETLVEFARHIFYASTCFIRKIGLYRTTLEEWMVGRLGLEPRTNGLKARCSTN